MPESTEMALPAPRPLLDRVLLAGAALAPAAVVAAGLAAPTWEYRSFLIFYVAPLFLAAPLWLRFRLATPSARPLASALLDALVLALSIMRLLPESFVPFSGHMLFLSYSVLTVRSPWYRVLAAALLIETTYFKLAIFGDPGSWWRGLAAGTVAGLVAMALAGGGAVARERTEA
jgi:hypothetical protein